ncbi:hypothetical protein B0H67DRAFT_551776 [Lasiosphaeris hirsuta]|uniref:Uncharacterized protein n=1 Tax=Lasiosphaeris hirsuta TaxID=260670 RepID=A0AA40E1P2_9PEZI|nr:hypothetical protein B0H67DRAFT_551776 [Lasiosphaeris hirsuta]
MDSSPEKNLALQTVNSKDKSLDPKKKPKVKKTSSKMPLFTTFKYAPKAPLPADVGDVAHDAVVRDGKTATKIKMAPGAVEAAIALMKEQRATILVKAQAQALRVRSTAIIVLPITAIAGLVSAYIFGTPEQRRGKE